MITTGRKGGVVMRQKSLFKARLTAAAVAVLVLAVIFAGCGATAGEQKQLTVRDFAKGIVEISGFTDPILEASSTLTAPEAELFLASKLTSDTASIDFVDIIPVENADDIPLPMVTYKSPKLNIDKSGISRCYSYKFLTKPQYPAHIKLTVCYAPELTDIKPVYPLAPVQARDLGITNQMSEYLKRHHASRIVTDGQVWAGNGVLVVLTDTYVVDINNPKLQTENTRLVKKLLRFTFDTFSEMLKEGK